MSTTDQQMREERKVITAMFADLVASTALAERLDPEDVKLVVNDAVTRVIGAVEAFGGTVKDLAGDGVLALFGAPQAHEDDPERAVRASLQAVADIADFAREVEQAFGIADFGVRVGVASGPVVVGAIGAGSRVEYAALGDAVNVAARLQAAAEPGTVLVSGATRTRIEPVFDWSEPRRLELKGKREPVTAYGVEGVRAGPGTARALAHDQTRLVGRERELERAHEVVDAAMAGSGRILFLTGEPGIGKTRLLAELRHHVESGSPERGRALWIEGRCVSYGESMPYWPFRDLLRTWIGVLADEPELRARVALRRNLDRLFGATVLEIYPYLGALLGLALEPEAQDRLAELSPEALQYRTFEVVRTLVARLAQDGPVAIALEDLHWADATSLQLLERLMADTETSALLLVLTGRPERDHPSWGLKESAQRELPHRTVEIALDALSGNAGRELLHAMVGRDTLPEEVQRRLLDSAEGNPFFLEELVRSLADGGALVREAGSWRFDHAVDVEVPPTVEKVILARIDRLEPGPRAALMAASVLGRQFGLPLLEALAGGDDGVRGALTDLQRLDLVRESRRWPEPEYRFKHVLIQEAAYRTLLTDERTRLHRKAADWLEATYAAREDEVAGLLAHHWLAAEDEDKAVTYLARAGDRARQEYALDEAIGHYRELLPILERRGERRAVALVLFKLALALHMSLRFGEANAAYQRAFEFWTPVDAPAEPPSATLRIATSFLPNDPDPRSAIAWPNIQLCMQLFDRLVEAWPERTIVPSLAERWEISDDGLRYLFHLREGLLWSDGTPLTAHDVEFGIKRVLNPDAPGSSVAIYFALENGQDYYLRRSDDAEAIGVRALDDRTVEFRLVAPAPYFMSVMNRPDGGPQPRHVIERHGDGWVDPAVQVVSGPFRIEDRTGDRLVLRRRPEYGRGRPGNAAAVEFVKSEVGDAIEPYARDELDFITVRYTPRLADLVPDVASDASLGPASWSAYIAFDHADPVLRNPELRRALAYAVDRAALDEVVPDNLVVARGGIVPPALQGHTPDIVLPFDPDAARACLERSEVGSVRLSIGGYYTWVHPFLDTVTETWREVLGIESEIVSWTLDDARPVWGGQQRPRMHVLDPTKKLTDVASIYITGWLPGYADPEYFLRLLFHSDSRTNEGGFSHPPFDELIERARQERSDRARLELFHEADRMAVAERIAAIPLVYGRSMAFVKPRVKGWWEFGKSSSSFADLVVDSAR
jgi:ABC-type oligopeptide transport system substrate-binding subunit/class 3 adenylate cyclase